MRRKDLLRVVSDVASRIGQQYVVVIGSQSILASYNHLVLPNEASISAEADVLPFDDASEDKIVKIEVLVGVDSPYYEKHGVYADGVSPWTARLPDRWIDRLIPITDHTTDVTALCLHPEDVAVAKVMAHRAKDREFLSAVFKDGLIDPRRVEARLATIDVRPDGIEDWAVERASAFLTRHPTAHRLAALVAPSVEDLEQVRSELEALYAQSRLCGVTASLDGPCQVPVRECDAHLSFFRST